MKVEIKIPAMGESISEVGIGTILKPSGSKVKQDEELLEIETEKVNQVLYAPAAGIFHLTVSSGDTVKVGTVVGSIETVEGVVAEKPEKPIAPQKTVEPEKDAKAVPTQRDRTKESVRRDRSDFISEIKKENDEGKKEIKERAPKQVSTEQGSVENSTGNVSSHPSRPETRKKMSRLRQAIAKRLLEAQHNAAMLTTFNEVDMSEIMALREKYKESFVKLHGVKLGFMSFFVKAVVVALKDYPGLNSYIEGQDLVHRNYYDISIAISSDRGLVVPVVRQCDQLSFAEIERAIEEYAKKAREGGLSLEDLQGGGFTITNGGVFGSLLSTPILNPPQSGILGMHKIQKRAVVVEDQIVIRPMMYLALSYDHRVVDGKEAVSFLVTLKNCLEDPSRLQLQV